MSTGFCPHCDTTVMAIAGCYMDSLSGEVVDTSVCSECEHPLEE